MKFIPYFLLITSLALSTLVQADLPNANITNHLFNNHTNTSTANITTPEPPPVNVVGTANPIFDETKIPIARDNHNDTLQPTNFTNTTTKRKLKTIPSIAITATGGTLVGAAAGASAMKFVSKSNIQPYWRHCTSVAGALSTSLAIASLVFGFFGSAMAETGIASYNSEAINWLRGAAITVSIQPLVYLISALYGGLLAKKLSSKTPVMPA